MVVISQTYKLIWKLWKTKIKPLELILPDFKKKSKEKNRIKTWNHLGR